MNVSPRNVAEAILRRRNSLSAVILTGELQAEIGAAGLAEALARRWAVPDHESGFLKVTNQLGLIREMEDATGPDPKVGDSVTVTADGKAYQGVVKQLANGKFKVSFTGSERPANSEADYDSTSVRLMGRPDQDGKVQPVDPNQQTRRPVSGSPVVP